ncbi:MAG TPA: CpsD/CapB family tyrosine-protein kinase [Terriglobales bacterium]|nr:CpsD/CapB family tyrosine-protein kinase [Terriglobales bacterium]
MSRNFEVLQKLELEREKEEQQRAASGSVRMAAAVTAPPLQDSAAGSVLLTMENPSRDQLTNLTQRLFLAAGGPRVVIFSGLQREVGCSWVAGRTAQLLASQVGASVCLVDANFRFPTLHDSFSIPNHHGLADAVFDASPVRTFVRQIASPNLWLLSCGSPEKLSQATAASEVLRTRLNQVRGEFDYVIIDTPPLNQYSDAMSLASAADGIVLVVKANTSRRDAAQKVMRDAKVANLRILGAVLNQRTYPVPQAIYDRL